MCVCVFAPSSDRQPHKNISSSKKKRDRRRGRRKTAIDGIPSSSGLFVGSTYVSN